MTSFDRLRRILVLPFRRPELLGLSAVYAAILTLTSARASLYDIDDPFWVVTVAAVILLSPVYHAAFLHLAEGILRGRRRPMAGTGARILICLPALILGELLVNGLVVLGSLAFFIPGVYLGVRFGLYKQAIVFSGAKPMMAIRESLQRTTEWRQTSQVFGSLAVFFSVMIGTAMLLSFLPSLWMAETMGAAVAALLLTWINLYLTVVYIEADVASGRGVRG